jgi:hypothetical protein
MASLQAVCLPLVDFSQHFLPGLALPREYAGWRNLTPRSVANWLPKRYEIERDHRQAPACGKGGLFCFPQMVSCLLVQEKEIILNAPGIA